MDQRNFSSDYDTLLDLVKSRASVRKLKPDAVPDDHVARILEVGRWAMSGANGQPWDFIVVKDAETKRALFRAYIEENNDFIYWMEQQRDFKLRHPSFQMTHDEALQKHRNEVGWSVAPVLIVIVGDGRRQWATVQGAHTFGRYFLLVNHPQLSGRASRILSLQRLIQYIRDKKDVWIATARDVAEYWRATYPPNPIPPSTP